MNVVEKKSNENFSERLNTSGFRFTPQRQHVYDVVMHKRDHPDGGGNFHPHQKTMPEISHATVYNCLDALVKCGLVRQVQLERGATRFCPNMEEHCHYFCDECGTVFDVRFRPIQRSCRDPKGFKVDHYDIAVHGVCAECATKK